MDLERTYNVTLDVKIDEEDFNINSKLDDILKIYRESLSADEDSTKTLEAIDSLYNDLDKTNISGYSFSNKKIIQELNGEDFFADNLKSRLNQIVTNSFNSAKALKDLESFIKARKEFVKDSIGLNASLKKFDIKPYYNKEDYEVGILIPSEGKYQNLKAFERVIKDWNFILKTFNEIIKKDSSDIKIDRICSGSYQLFINETFEIAENILAVVGKITTLYLTLKALSPKFGELRKLKALKKTLPSFEEVKKQTVADEIDHIKNDVLIKFGKEIEDGRKAELSTALEKSLILVIKHISDGVILEINPPYVSEPDPVEADATDETKEENKKDIENYKALFKKVELIKKSSESLKSLAELSSSTFKLLEEKIDDDDNEDIGNAPSN